MRWSHSSLLWAGACGAHAFSEDGLAWALSGGANATLVGNVTTLNLTASVIDSAIGPMPGISIKALAKTLGPIVQKLINALLGKGIPLSPKGGLLSNGTVFTEDGFITLAADFAKLL